MFASMLKLVSSAFEYIQQTPQADDIFKTKITLAGVSLECFTHSLKVLVNRKLANYHIGVYKCIHSYNHTLGTSSAVHTI